ncbi:MAG: FCD domain-containing protein [Hyphomicrobiaceae bacterium]
MAGEPGDDPCGAEVAAGRGLVEYRKRRGTFVTSISEADVLEIYTLREMLEAFAARRAAQRVSAHGEKSLERIMRNMRRSPYRRPQADARAGFRVPSRHRQHERTQATPGDLCGSSPQTRLFLPTMTDVLHHDLEDAIAHHEPLRQTPSWRAIINGLSSWRKSLRAGCGRAGESCSTRRDQEQRQDKGNLRALKLSIMIDRSGAPMRY